MRSSYRVRLVAAFALVGVAGAALVAILVNLAFNAALQRYLQAQRQTREETVVAALADSYVRSRGWDATDLQRIAPLVQSDGGYVRLQDAQGRTIWTAWPAAPGSHMGRMTGGSPTSTSALTPERSLPVTVGGTTVGTAYIRMPPLGVLPQDQALQATVNVIFVLGGLAGGLIAVVLGVLLARRATSPVRELTAAARALAAGDRAVRVRDDSPDEFGQMARAFNHMAGAVETEDRLRRSFAADVAHELRTPLSILRSHVEALQDGIRRPSPALYESLHQEVLRLSRLVADLEVLASADASGFTIEHQRIDLGAQLRTTAEQFAGLFDDHEVRLRTDLGDPLVVEADPVRVRQAVSNLLANALKFTPAGGTVDLAMRREPGVAVVRVSDTGRGIPADELPHVFERFFRGRAARGGGSGIGLTVVRELVRAHGGEAQVLANAGPGCTFVLRFPLASSDPRVEFTADSQRLATVPPHEEVSPGPAGRDPVRVRGRRERLRGDDADPGAHAPGRQPDRD